MQEACGRTLSLSHLFAFPLGSPGEKSHLWGFHQGCRLFRTSLGAGRLRQVACAFALWDPCSKCACPRVPPCCSGFALPITEAIHSIPCCLGPIWLPNPYLEGSPGWLSSGSLGTNYEAVLDPYSLLSAAIS